MSPEASHNWQDVAIAVATALPAIIAAAVGVRNGRKIDRHDDWERNGRPVSDASRVKKRPKKNGQHPDWYSPPKL